MNRRAGLPCVTRRNLVPGSFRTHGTRAQLTLGNYPTQPKRRLEWATRRRRGPVVEFCHAWIKSKLGLRQFHVRGLVKVKTEMLWAALTYNIQLRLRLMKA